MSVDIKKLRELDAAATPGPWSVIVDSFGEDDKYTRCGGIATGNDAMPLYDRTMIVETDSGFYPPDLPTAHLIATMRNALPELLDEIERLREANKWLDAWRGMSGAKALEAENERLRADYDDLFNNLYKKQSDENDRLRDENEQLRAALRLRSDCPACKLDDDLEAEGLQLLAELESENE